MSSSTEGQEPVRQVSVLVHRSDGSSSPVRLTSSPFPAASPSNDTLLSGRGGAHALRSFLQRVWRGAGEDPSSSRRLELSFSSRQPPLPTLASVPRNTGDVEAPGADSRQGNPSTGALEVPTPDSSPQDTTGDDVAAAAERHRLTTSIGMDVAGVVEVLERDASFLGLALFLFVCRNAACLAVVALLTYALHHVNRLVRGFVAGRDATDMRRLLVPGLAAVLASAASATFLLRPARRAEALAGFWACLLMVVALDACARLLVAAIKLLVIAAAACDSPRARRRRAALLTFVEHGSTTLRALGPIPLWTLFLMQGGVPFLVSYAALKAKDMRGRVRAVLAAGRAVVSSNHGTTPSTAEVAEAGGLCPICQDPPSAPTKLPCGHIFCDACVSEWFARERSCPICRATTGETKAKSFGDGRTPLMPILF